ncbi:MAG: hypothetical protein NC483_00470 [Ruminococcus sp.]|nr:hypothetical protein [Ruminococcus sp.]
MEKHPIIEKLAKLIDLKSILSLGVVGAYTFMCIKGIVEADYKDIVIMVMTFYFAKKDGEK